MRDALHGVWLGHPVYPLLVQVPAGAWVAARILDFTGGAEKASWQLAGAGLAAGANHAEEMPHLVELSWHDLMAAADAPEGRPVRRLLGEVPVVAVRTGGAVHVLADRCRHISGPLSDSELTDGCLTCPWHGSVFRVADGAVVRGPATAPRPAFEVREADGVIQVCLPGTG